MIAIIDYGAGNIRSLKNALDYLDIESILTNDTEIIKRSDRIILPGVGAFPSAMKMLDNFHLTNVLKAEAKKKPFLGICLGMQMLFDKSVEFEECKGLELIPGKVDLIDSKNVIIPHMGWNMLKYNIVDDKLMKDIGNKYVYFVHSYQAYCAYNKNLVAYCEYGTSKIPAVVTDGNFVYGTQFHPEKSSNVGLQILKKFGEM